jgi:malate permease and related proteins
VTILTTILPIFLVIMLGWAVHQRGFLPQAFLGPGNRLVFYLGIPAMIFRSISRASLTTQFDIRVVLTTLAAVLAVFGLTWFAVGFVRGVRMGQRGTIVQSTFHGNIGYIALAISFYALGNAGLVRAIIIAAFVMILQNLLAIFILQYYSDNAANKGNVGRVFLKILGNPVILSSLAGILVSLSGIPVPKVMDQTLEIIGSFALPMALLIIGASLTFDLVRYRIASVLSVSAVKLIILPGLGYMGFRFLGLSAQDYVPGLIILATPTATITMVMAFEIGGDMDFAAATVSVSTLLSAITFSLWLALSGMMH